MSTTRRLYFVRHHSGRRTIPSCPLQCIFTTVSNNITQLEYPPSYHFDYPKHVIVGSCNGILCLVNDPFLPVDDTSIVVLWNPSLRKVKELPQPSYPNLSIRAISYGFGYDFATDNYKVVAVLTYKVGILLEKAVVMINTLGTNFWKDMKDFPFDSILVNFQPGRFVSGAIHWLASKCRFNGPCFIVSLDLGTESYQKFPLPDCGDGDQVSRILLRVCVLKDCLCFISGHDVWIMKEYGNKESWIKLFSLSYMGEPSIYNFLVNAVYMFEDGQVLFESHEDGYLKMCVHDPTIGTIKYIKFQDKSVYDHVFDRCPFNCIESLISSCF
jgi:F-box interacting protein